MDTARSKPPTRTHRMRWLTAAALLLTTAGCLYDPDDVCGPEQEVDEAGACVCAPNAAPGPDGHGCVPCRPDEVPSADGCACPQGTARAAEGEACQALPAGLAAACDTAGPPCADPVYSHCQAVDGTSGYCTSAGCAVSEECPAGYACDGQGATAYCKRPPTGLLEPCDGHQDCAGYDATYCETFQTHQCLVQDCTLAPDSCHEGWQCCDLAGLGVDERLCVPVGECPT